MRWFLYSGIYLFCLLPSVPAAAATHFDHLQRVGKSDVHYLGVIKVYDAELYTQTNATLEDVQNARADFCLALDYSVDLTADKFILAAEKTLQKQRSAEQLETMRALIDELHSRYQDVKKGDQYTLCYNAVDQTTHLALNGKPLAVIASREFASLYSGIWLGNKNPIDSKLQAELLNSLRERQAR